MVNASWDIIIVVLIVSGYSVLFPQFRYFFFYSRFIKAVFWVETKGLTLEEIDAIFEGQKHSNAPDVELVRAGKVDIDVGQVERELHTIVQTTKLE